MFQANRNRNIFYINLFPQVEKVDLYSITLYIFTSRKKAPRLSLLINWIPYEYHKSPYLTLADPDGEV